MKLVAIGYKYKKHKVLLFVATKGAALTLDGEPYIQRWEDEHGNVLSRPILRPGVLSGYFSVSPRVDNHNQSHQHDLALEDHWQTHCCWDRLHTTMIGITATDAWKLTRYHTQFGDHLHSSAFLDFADELSYALLSNGFRDQEAPSRAVPERAPVGPVLHTHSHHVPVTLGRKPSGRARQAGCRWCFSDEGAGELHYKQVRKCDHAVSLFEQQHP